jgi:hypothetical protein
VNAEIDAEAGPLRDRLKAIAERLQPWWAVHGREETGGNRSTHLAGCRIGHRRTPERLTHAGKRVADMVKTLRELGLNGFLSVKYALDKAALIRTLQADGEGEAAERQKQQLRALGFDLKSDDEFYIDPEPAKSGPAPAKKEAA